MRPSEWCPGDVQRCFIRRAIRIILEFTRITWAQWANGRDRTTCNACAILLAWFHPESLSLGPQQTRSQPGSSSSSGQRFSARKIHLLTQAGLDQLVSQKNVCLFPQVTTPNFSPVRDTAIRGHSTGPSRGKSRVERFLGQVQTGAVQGPSTFPILSQHQRSTAAIWE